MLITRTPLRISIGGGGTDLPSYYREFGGYVISAAINRYVYIGINRTFSDDYLLKYSALERVKTIPEIQHPIFREALRMLNVEPPVEIVSLADVPAGTGLGSSGSFTVGLLRAIHAYRREHIASSAVAEEACRIEMDILQQPVGKQDQYIAAHGGLTAFEFRPDDSVAVETVKVPSDALFDLEDRLLMFFTGYSREATSILGDQKQRSVSRDPAMLENLHHIKALGLEIKGNLEKGNTREYGRLLHEHWLIKQRRSGGMSNACIDELYNTGIRNGALGGKLVGAGGGGFLMFYAEDRGSLRRAMSASGLVEMRFQFDYEGSVVHSRE
jgi:D-glycero-alpha-D-manno-heptose-7-phosphate kinase